MSDIFSICCISLSFRVSSSFFCSSDFSNSITNWSSLDLNEYDFNVDVYENIEDIFYDLCSRGLINIVKWLLELNPHIDFTYAFDCIYTNEHLEVMKWLLKTRKSKITLVFVPFV